MKKRRWMTLVMLLAIMAFAACGSSESSVEEVNAVLRAEDSAIVEPESVGASNETDRTVDEIISALQEAVEEGGGSVKEASENLAEEVRDQEEQTAGMEELVVYYSNSKADGLEMETIFVETVTPEVMIDSLARHNIVSIDTKVNGFEAVEEDGKDVLRLDLSKAFGEYLKTMGTSGETVIMSALTDTFLQAYGADALQITVDGEVLETGHQIYDEPLTFVEISLNMDSAAEPDGE